MSSDIEKEPLSRQQKKSKETKARIFHAAKTILQKQGYDQLSIKNICDEAGVSNGSFYHHFKTKDDLLSLHQQSYSPPFLPYLQLSYVNQDLPHYTLRHLCL